MVDGTPKTDARMENNTKHMREFLLEFLSTLIAVVGLVVIASVRQVQAVVIKKLGMGQVEQVNKVIYLQESAQEGTYTAI